jgi:hypothetical protein
MKPTPIKWLLEQLKVCNYISKKGYKNTETWLIQEALEYEKEHQNEFTIKFTEWCIKNTKSIYSSGEGALIRFKKDYYTVSQLLEIYKKEKNL